MNRLSRLKIITPAVLLLVANVFLFGTATLFKFNQIEFEFSYLASLPALLLYTLTTSLLLIAPGLFLTKKHFQFYAATLYFLALASWVQGNLILWDFGVFDGNAIQWEKHSAKTAIDIALWLVLGLVILFFRKRLLPILSTAALLLFVLQSVTLLYDGGKGRLSAYTNESRQFPPEGLFQYSRTQNIIQILFDGFQTETFLKIVQEESLQEKLDGFTVYADNIPRYGSTMKSVGAIFSGAEKPADVTFSEWLKLSLSNSGYMEELAAAGYTINVVPHVPVSSENFSNYYKIPAAYGGTRKDAISLQAAKLIDSSLFKYAPTPLKQRIYNNQAWLLQNRGQHSQYPGHLNQIAFFTDYSEQIQPSIDAPAYHFIHIISPHPPFVNTPECEGKNHLPQNQEYYTIQARCVIKKITSFIDQLKSNDLFEDALIIVHADHGIEYPVDITENQEETSPKPATQARKFSPSSKKIGRATALLMVKYPNSSSPMQISDLQTSTLDISSTVLGIAGIDSTTGRNNLYTPEAGKFGPRKFANFIIDGSVYNTGSWYSPVVESSQITIKPYKIGDTIDFRGLGNAEQYSIKGWSWGGVDATWTNGKSAILEIPLAKPFHREALITTELAIRGRKQFVKVKVNNIPVFEDFLEWRGFKQWELPVPIEVLASRSELLIEIILPDVKPLNHDKKHLDGRALGLRFKSMKLEESTP